MIGEFGQGQGHHGKEDGFDPQREEGDDQRQDDAQAGGHAAARTRWYQWAAPEW